jgi:phage-related protein
MPALDVLRALNRDERQKASAYLSYEKLYELRPKQIRLLYAFVGAEYAVILHAFRKKTGPVPDRDKHLAQTRLAEFMRRYARGEFSRR